MGAAPRFSLIPLRALPLPYALRYRLALGVRFANDLPSVFAGEASGSRRRRSAGERAG